jgi:NAD(P)-dependent dehydrogenase (short-subunit alcohol dehydrogenase family)
MLLAGKTAVVTGGSRGVGFEICKIFLENGADVLAVSRDNSKLSEAKGRLSNLHTLRGDVGLAEDVDNIAVWVARQWGRLDILINNAAIDPHEGEDLLGQPDEMFERVFNANARSVYLCTKRLAPFLLKADDAKVVNVSSISGILSPHLTGVYGIAKAAMHGMTIAFSNAFKGKVAVNAMSPGGVKTDMNPYALGDPRSSGEMALWVVTQPSVLTATFCRNKADVGWMPLDVIKDVAAQTGNSDDPFTFGPKGWRTSGSSSTETKS